MHPIKIPTNPAGWFAFSKIPDFIPKISTGYVNFTVFKMISVSNGRPLFDEGYKNEYANASQKSVAHSQSTKDFSSYHSKDKHIKQERPQHHEPNQFEPYIPGQKEQQKTTPQPKKAEERPIHNVQFGQTKPRTQHRNEYYDNSGTYQNDQSGKIHKSQSGPSLFRLGQKSQVQPPPVQPIRRDSDTKGAENHDNEIHERLNHGYQPPERTDDYTKRYPKREHDKDFSHESNDKETPRYHRDNGYRPNYRNQDDHQKQGNRDNDQKPKSNRQKQFRQQPQNMAGGAFT